MTLASAPVLAQEAAPAKAPASGKAPAEMPWETSYATALKKAEAESKPILFDFYTGWCPHCTRMDKSTWKDAALIGIASKSFVSAKINADVEKAPVSRYRLMGYPTMIVATSKGEQIFRLEGYVDAAGMKRAMSAYVERQEAILAAQATLATDKKNVAAAFTLADAQAAAGIHASAADHYFRLSKNVQGDDFMRASAGAGLNMTRAGKAKEAAKILAKAQEAAGAKLSADLLYALAETEKALGNASGAKTWADRLASEHPSSPEAALLKASS